MHRPVVTLFLLLIVLAYCSGCGGGVATSTVHGTVKVDGQPLSKGTISFQSLDGNTPTSGGEINNGAYSVKVPRGAQKVMVSCPEVTGSRKAYELDPNSPLIPITKEKLPLKYTNPFETPLSVDVNAGSVKQDFDVSTMP